MRQGLVYNTTSNELTAGAFNTYSVCFNTITSTTPPFTAANSAASFALTPLGSGITATIWQCTCVGTFASSVNIITIGTFSYFGTAMAGISNVSGDYASPTRFYGVSGDTNLYFSCGDFGTLTSVRFTFMRIY